MATTGFDSAPLTLSLILTTLTTSTLTHLFPPTTQPTALHGTLRVLSPATLTHLLLTTSLLYQLRVIERLWGTKKLAAFLLTVTPYIAAIASGGYMQGLELRGFVPGAVVWALLGQWWKAVPYEWKYSSIGTGEGQAGQAQAQSGQEDGDRIEEVGVQLSSKWTVYAMAFFPGGLGAAALGWTLGWAWRVGMLPGKDIVDGVFGLEERA